jgi:hypothetical protein
MVLALAGCSDSGKAVEVTGMAGEPYEVVDGQCVGEVFEDGPFAGQQDAEGDIYRHTYAYREDSGVPWVSDERVAGGYEYAADIDFQEDGDACVGDFTVARWPSASRTTRRTGPGTAPLGGTYLRRVAGGRTDRARAGDGRVGKRRGAAGLLPAPAVGACTLDLEVVRRLSWTSLPCSNRWLMPRSGRGWRCGWSAGTAVRSVRRTLPW